MKAQPPIAWLPDFSPQGREDGIRARKAIEESLAEAAYTSLDLYYFAASVPGWQLLAPSIDAWANATPGRTVRAWIGTDLGASDPLALTMMLEAGVKLHFPLRYNGTYHPKMIVLTGRAGGHILLGSHNLSKAAFTTNGEISAALRFTGALPAEIADWTLQVQDASDDATEALIKSYEQERNRFHKAYKPRTFTWSKRGASPTKKGTGKAKAATEVVARAGALVMEITPLETGSGGKQVQPPMAVLTPFFGLPAGGATSKIVQARLKGVPHFGDRTVRRNANSTGRVHIPELDYDDRPCFMVFTRAGPNFEYEIVSEAREPARYAALSTAAINQGNRNARRWVVLDKDVSI